MLSKFLKCLAVILAAGISFSASISATTSGNQTDDLSPIGPQSQAPFSIQIQQADFSLPGGIQSFAYGVHHGKWLLLDGRTNGMHYFNNDDFNFPALKQNTVVYVVDPATKTVSYRDLADPSSGLTQDQIDLLSVTAPQYDQVGSTLYITGGYGVITSTGQFSTKDVLTAIDMPGLIHWVQNPDVGETAAQHIRQLSHPIFRVTGGYMTSFGPDTLLVFGQNFAGFYTDNSNGNYTEQVLRFQIKDNGTSLSVKVKSPKPSIPDPNYRRRDLNVVPIIQMHGGVPVPSLVALAGVFTTQTGYWTVPVVIDFAGNPSMADPASPSTFKQGMNIYNSAVVPLFSPKKGENYITIFGGITYEYWENGVLQQDAEFPFTNQVTTIKISKGGNFSQYLMDGQFPTIPSTGPNVGLPMLFGAGAKFIPAQDVPRNEYEVINFDGLGKGPVLIGYIVGGIQSTVPNTSPPPIDSFSSPYIFEVYLTK